MGAEMNRGSPAQAATPRPSLGWLTAAGVWPGRERVSSRSPYLGQNAAAAVCSEELDRTG